MAPTEVTEILRHLDGWPVQSHSCKKVQEAIGAAVEMVERLAEVQRVGRSESGKPLLECVVVEAGWPEYEPTWQAIEARVTGAQPAPKAVAYLDLGVGGYMDIGTDLTDEELATLPKGRHMLGVIGTYGVDGYVPAQPAPSVLEDVMRDVEWKRELFIIKHAMAMNNWDWKSEASNDMKRAAYAAVVKLLAAAQEAKP